MEDVFEKRELVQKITLRKLFSFIRRFWVIFLCGTVFSFATLSCVFVFATPSTHYSSLSFEYGREKDGQRVPRVIGSTDTFSEFENVLKASAFLEEVYTTISSTQRFSVNYDVFKRGIIYPSFSIADMSTDYTVQFEYNVKGYASAVSKEFAELGIEKLQKVNTFKYTIIKEGSPSVERSNGKVLKKVLLIALSLVLSCLLALAVELVFFLYKKPVVLINDEIKLLYNDIVVIDRKNVDETTTKQINESFKKCENVLIDNKKAISKRYSCLPLSSVEEDKINEYKCNNKKKNKEYNRLTCTKKTVIVSSLYFTNEFDILKLARDYDTSECLLVVVK